MNKILKSLALLLLFSMLFFPTAHAKSYNGKQSLVSLGDSIPYGSKLNQHNHTPSKSAYPYLIGDEANLRVQNLGVPGWKTSDLLLALKTDQKYRQAIRHADYVTITIGSNDLLKALKNAQRESGGDPILFLGMLLQKIQESHVFENLGAILEEVRSLTGAPIVVYNIYNPFQLDNPLHALGQRVLPMINANIEAITSTYNKQFGNVMLADAYGAFGENQATYVIRNDIHPTIEGQIKLAEIGLEALNQK